MEIRGREAILQKFTTTGLGIATQLALDCCSSCQTIPSLSLAQVLNLHMRQQNSELLYSTEDPSAKEEEMICLHDLSHGFIHNAPSVPAGKRPTTTSAWKNTSGFPSCQMRCYNQQTSTPGESRAFGKFGWQRELGHRSEAGSLYIASFLKYSLLFYTFQM